MTLAKSGDKVSVHYTGTLNDGSQFDSSQGREPLEFVIGSNQIIAGFSEAVTGMSVGEKKSVTIASDMAYGARNADMVQVVPRTRLPDDIELQEGIGLTAQGPEGQVINFKVIAFDDENVTLDGNHPLADKDLTFQLELVSIS